MKGDLSKLRFSPGKNYISVILQQGRVTLDSDAGPNESEILNVDLGLGLTHQVPLGRRPGTHRVTITRETSRASPIFSRALAAHEVLQSVRIHFSRESRGYFLTLTDAVVAHIKRVTKPGAKGTCEEVQFSCSEMETMIDRSS